MAVPTRINIEDVIAQMDAKRNADTGLLKKTIGFLAGRSEVDVAAVRSEKKRLDDERRKALGEHITWAENEEIMAAGGDLYSSIGKKTKDLGKYQVHPNALADWSEEWLGKKYTQQEFLKDAKAQEDFFNQFLDVADKYKLTPEQTAVAWHRGWGELGTGDRETRAKRFLNTLGSMMNEPESVEYLKRFNAYDNRMKQPIDKTEYATTIKP